MNFEGSPATLESWKASLKLHSPFYFSFKLFQKLKTLSYWTLSQIFETQKLKSIEIHTKLLRPPHSFHDKN